MSNNLLMKIKVETGAQGPRGLTGLTPQLSVANTITGEPNTNANVTIAGTAENPALTFTIPIGRPFEIAAEYPTVSDLENNTNPVPSGYIPENFDLAIITSDQGVEDPDNAKLYIYDSGPIGGWSFVSDLSGATGPRRNLRWKEVEGQTTSILQWELEDGSYDETNARDLALKFQFNVDLNNNLILEIENPDGVTDTINLTASAEFGNGVNATVTSVRFNDNNGNTTTFQELGVYASWNNTELTLTNPDNQTVEQELALDFNWDGTKLQIKNPAEATYAEANEQKLSPDISFNTDNGVEISVVEPGAAEDLIKISPDIAFQNDGNGLELSIVEPGIAQSFNKVSPDITWDGTKLAITEPDTAPVSGDYVELGVYGQFGEGTTTVTTLTLTNPDSTDIVQELGVYGSFDSQTSDTTIVLTNPDNTTAEQELGVYGSFDSETSDTTLVLTNPDETTVEQELGVYAEFDSLEVTKVIFTNPDETTVEQELGMYGSFDSQQSVTTLVITNPDEQTVEQELGVYAEWGTTAQETNRTLTLTNPDNQTISRDLGIEYNWDGTQLGIKTADDQDFTYVDLKGETGDASVSGTALFKIRDDDDVSESGYQVTVGDEIQIKGTNAASVDRNNGIFTIDVNVIDGGEF